MIREIRDEEQEQIIEFLEQDIGRNYFILLGMMNVKKTFHKIFGQFEDDELKALLFKRNSNMLQFFAPDKFNEGEFVNLIKGMDYQGLIGCKSYCEGFLNKGFQVYKDGAYIAKLDRRDYGGLKEIKYEIKELEIEDLDDTVKIYKECFSSFAPKEVMAEKLQTKRGQGVYIEENGEIISIAQTDFEISDGALIVGVATKKEHRGKGLATECLQFLCNDLTSRGKDVYLQYDNMEAGKVYERLGFKVIDQVIHLKR